MSEQKVHVHKVKIIGTHVTVYSAWVPSRLMGPHTSLHSFPDVDPQVRHWGQIASERVLPDDIEALPAFTAERMNAVRAWREDRYAVAHRHIIAAYPEAAGGTKRGADIEVVSGEQKQNV